MEQAFLFTVFLEDINEIIREADSRMYEKKRSMKHRKA